MYILLFAKVAVAVIPCVLVLFAQESKIEVFSMAGALLLSVVCELRLKKVVRLLVCTHKALDGKVGPTTPPSPYISNDGMRNDSDVDDDAGCALERLSQALTLVADDGRRHSAASPSWSTVEPGRYTLAVTELREVECTGNEHV